MVGIEGLGQRVLRRVADHVGGDLVARQALDGDHQADDVLDGLECPFQYGPGVGLDDLDVGQGELGPRFQGAGGDDDWCLFLRGAEHAGHQGKGDQGQDANDDDR